MIRLDGGYAIDVDSMSYVVGIAKMTEVVDKKTGEKHSKEIITEPKYYSTLDQALFGYWKMMRRKCLYNFEGSLTEALEVVKKQDEKIRKLIEGVKEGAAK
jgi:hypothetical protein